MNLFEPPSARWNSPIFDARMNALTLGTPMFAILVNAAENAATKFLEFFGPPEP